MGMKIGPKISELVSGEIKSTRTKKSARKTPQTGVKNGDKTSLSPAARGSGAGLKSRLGKVKTALLGPVDASAQAPVSREEGLDIMGILRSDLLKGGYLPFVESEGQTRQISYLEAVNKLEKGKNVLMRKMDNYGDDFYKSQYLRPADGDHAEFKLLNLNQLRDVSAQNFMEQFANRAEDREFFRPFKPGENGKGLTFDQAFKRLKKGKSVDFQEGRPGEAKDCSCFCSTVSLSNLTAFVDFANRTLNKREPGGDHLPDSGVVLEQLKRSLGQPIEEGKIVYQPYLGKEKISYAETEKRLSQNLPVEIQPLQAVNCYDGVYEGAEETLEYRKLGESGDPHNTYLGVKAAKVNSMNELREFYRIERRAVQWKAEDLDAQFAGGYRSLGDPEV